MSEPIHVYPVNDLVFHELTEQCLCEPVIILEGPAKIIIHNAWDEREKVESGVEMLEISTKYIN